MSPSLVHHSFDRSSLGTALLEVSREARLVDSRILPSFLPGPAGEEHVTPWLDTAADNLGFDCQAVNCSYSELDRVLDRCAPAIIAFRAEETTRYLAVLRRGRRDFQVLAPNLRIVSVPLQHVREQMLSTWAKESSLLTDYCLARTKAHNQTKRREALSKTFTRERIEGIWLLCPDPGTRFFSTLKALGVWKRLAAVGALSIAQVFAFAYSWVLLARGALHGFIEPAMISAWGLMLLGTAMAHTAALGLGKRALSDANVLIRSRLFRGAMRMDRDELRVQGSGRLLATVGESEILTNVGLLGALALGMSILHLVSAVVVCGLGAGGLASAGALVAWCAIMALLMLRYLGVRTAWSHGRFRLSQSALENVLGHRTRSTQQPEGRWHLEEDAELNDYGELSRRMDRLSRILSVLPARGWLVLGMSCLIPGVVASASTPAPIAIAVGGVFHAYAALSAIAGQVVGVCDALVAWQQVRPLFDRASQLRISGAPQAAIAAQMAVPARSGAVGDLLSVRNLSFAYDAKQEPILRKVQLDIASGERILIEGPSGGGKSTLASLMAGLRVPGTGQILLGGFDRKSVGDIAWRRSVVLVPQFHENHLLSATLAFNLLMGTHWPPRPGALQEAEGVCQALGLGPVLRRMPFGLEQVVGETGWQLSHGERSRVFLARAILQRPRVLILDESLGALDPKTVKECLEAICVRDLTVITIAHP